MIAIFGLSALRLIGAILVALSLLIAPAGGEKVNLEQSSVELCADDLSADAHFPGGADHEGHKHHQHGCGSCHIHILRGQASGLDDCHVSNVKIAILTANEPELSEPSGLFRPPRA